VFSLSGLVVPGEVSPFQSWAVSGVRTPICRLVIRAVDAVRGAFGFPVALFGDGFATNQPTSLVSKDHHNGYQCRSDKDQHDPYPLLSVHARPNLSPLAGSCVVLRKALAPSAQAGRTGQVRSQSLS